MLRDVIASVLAAACVVGLAVLYRDPWRREALRLRCRG